MLTLVTTLLFVLGVLCLSALILRVLSPRPEIELETVEVRGCPDREAAMVWIIANQLGRRPLTPSQRAALALEIEKQLAAEAKNRIILSESEKGRASFSCKLLHAGTNNQQNLTVCGELAVPASGGCFRPGLCGRLVTDCALSDVPLPSIFSER
jgi:hypothetical protein